MNLAAEGTRRRWERESRYYEVRLEKDLFGDWVLTKRWGRKGTALGGMKDVPCGSLEVGQALLAAVAKRRQQRGYALIRRYDNDH